MTLNANYVTMTNMRQFILMFTVAMFTVNAFAVSAWAKPCMGINDASSTMATMEMGDMPCHENQEEQKSPTKHCDGVCLCLHVSINQTPILNDTSTVDVPVGQLNHLLIKNERVTSMSNAPPQRPPKFNS